MYGHVCEEKLTGVVDSWLYELYLDINVSLIDGSLLQVELDLLQRIPHKTGDDREKRKNGDLSVCRFSHSEMASVSSFSTNCVRASVRFFSDRRLSF